MIPISQPESNGQDDIHWIVYQATDGPGYHLNTNHIYAQCIACKVNTGTLIETSALRLSYYIHTRNVISEQNRYGLPYV